MKGFPHIHTFITVLLLGGTMMLLPSVCDAQEIEPNPTHYYEHKLIHIRQPMPIPHVRENDVVWETCIWRTISLREKFNQYFYYPLERDGAQGRKNFAYMVWDAVVADQIPIYEDDEFKIPIDNADFVYRYTKADTIILEIVDDDENYEYKTVLVPKEFNSEEMLQIKLKEAWYLDKQTTGQYVRILGFALTQDLYKDVDGDRDFIGTATLFWVPMLSDRVRRLFATKEAYYEDNIAQLPTWEEVFHDRRFDSYVTRESNRFNRTIDSYVTGEDAIREAERIENHLLEISLDQWEW